MAKRSLKASPEGVKLAKRAFDRKQWTQEYLALEVGLSTRNSVWKFFACKPIEKHIFIDICFKLDLDWEDIADLGINNLNLPSTLTPPNLEKNQDKIPELINEEDDNIINNFEKISDCFSDVKSKIYLYAKTKYDSCQNSFPFNQNLSLSSIYIDLKLSSLLSSQRWLNISELESQINNIDNLSINKPLSSPQTVSVNDILSQYNRYIILGKAGSGKTTLLKYLAILYSEERLDNNYLPIFISLKIFAYQCQQNTLYGLTDYIKNTWQVLDIKPELINQLLSQGKILLLLDELESIEEKHRQLIYTEIQNFAQTYYLCPIIMTSRLGIKLDTFTEFNYLEIQDLEEEQIINYIDKWFSLNRQHNISNISLNKQFIQLLKRPENKLIYDLLKSPTLLSLVCYIFQERGDFPSQISKLYQESLELFLRQDVDNKHPVTESFFPDNKMMLADKINLLSEIAKFGTINNTYFFDKQEVINIIFSYLKKVAISQKNNSQQYLDNIQLTAEKILEDVGLNSGILSEKAKGIFCFSHITFQEYLTAYNLAFNKNIHDNNEYLNLIITNCLEGGSRSGTVRSHLATFRSHPLCLLTIEMLNNPDELLSEIKLNIDKTIQYQSVIKSILRSINDKVNSLNLDYNISALRAFYYGLLFTKDLNLATILDENLATTLNPELLLDQKLIRAVDLGVKLLQEKNFSLDRFLNLGFTLNLDEKLLVDECFKEELISIQQELLSAITDDNNLDNWLNNDYYIWLKSLIITIKKYRLIDTGTILNNEQKQVIYDYYDQNLFFVKCVKNKMFIDRNYTFNLDTILKINY